MGHARWQSSAPHSPSSSFSPSSPSSPFASSTGALTSKKSKSPSPSGPASLLCMNHAVAHFHPLNRKIGPFLRRELRLGLQCVCQPDSHSGMQICAQQRVLDSGMQGTVVKPRRDSCNDAAPQQRRRVVARAWPLRRKLAASLDQCGDPFISCDCEALDASPLQCRLTNVGAFSSWSPRSTIVRIGVRQTGHRSRRICRVSAQASQQALWPHPKRAARGADIQITHSRASSTCAVKARKPGSNGRAGVSKGGHGEQTASS